MQNLSKFKDNKSSRGSKIIGQSTFARINKHNDADSPFTKTVLIKNTPEAHQAFGVKNSPTQNVLKKKT